MWVADQAWKDEVRARLEANRVAGKSPRNMRELALAIHTTPPAVSTLLKKAGVSQTRLMPSINEQLGIGRPELVSVDEARASMDRDWKKLTPEERETVRGLVRALAGKR